MRYTDLTSGALAAVCEGWVCPGGNRAKEEAWIPRVMVRRLSQDAPLASTFVAVIEPHRGASAIRTIRRQPLTTPGGVPFPDTNVAVELELMDGRRDLILQADVENPCGLKPSLATDGVLVQADRDVRLDGEMCIMRWNASGTVERIVICRGTSVAVGKLVLELNQQTDFVEIKFGEEAAIVASGDRDAVRVVKMDGRMLSLDQPG